MPPSQEQATGLQFTARIASLREDTFVVTGFRLEEQLSTLFSLTLNLTSSFSGINVSEVLDQPAILTIWQDGEPQSPSVRCRTLCLNVSAARPAITAPVTSWWCPQWNG